MNSLISDNEATVSLQENEANAGRYKSLLFGLLVFILFEYIRFGQWIGALAPLHPQKMIAIVTLVGFIFTFKDQIRHPKVMLYFLIAITLSCLFNLGNLYFSGGYQFITILLKITASYYLVCNLLIALDNIKKFISIYLLSNFVLVLAGLAVGGYKGALREGVFAGGFVSDSNDYALAVNVILPFYWYLFVYEKGLLKKSIFGACFIMCVVAVMYSFSRGGFLGLCATLLYAMLTHKKKAKYAAACAIVLGFAFLFVPLSYWERMQTIHTYEMTDDGRSSSELRLKLWEIGINMVNSNPFFGVGPGNFPTKIVQYGAEVVQDQNELLFLSGRATHNTFINIASELGLVGFFLFMALIFRAHKDATISQDILQQMQWQKELWLQALPPAIKASIIAYCVTSCFITSHLYPHIYMLSGLAFALRSYCDANRLSRQQ